MANHFGYILVGLQNLNRSHNHSHAPFRDGGLGLAMINLCTKFEISTFTHHKDHHHLFAQSTLNSHVQQCNVVEQDSKVQERTLTAARKRSTI